MIKGEINSEKFMRSLEFVTQNIFRFTKHLWRKVFFIKIQAVDMTITGKALLHKKFMAV